jgi:hypothetical protein
MPELERPAKRLFQFFLAVSVASVLLAAAIPNWFREIVELFPVRVIVFLSTWGLLAACFAFVWNLSRIRDPRRFLESLARAIVAITIVFVGAPVLVLPRIQMDANNILVDPGGKPLLDSASLSAASAVMFLGSMVALMLLGAMYIYVAIEERNRGPFGSR